jgi:hypothetical protein
MPYLRPWFSSLPRSIRRKPFGSLRHLNKEVAWQQPHLEHESQAQHTSSVWAIGAVIACMIALPACSLPCGHALQGILRCSALHRRSLAEMAAVLTGMFELGLARCGDRVGFWLLLIFVRDASYEYNLYHCLARFV